ncbi:aldo/keto reductase, partial [Klebsiella pneumoniae]|uniref:aldo/keto reductase n=1 Tax=Klebsiella pneumoniae TaxID=573 RepID=UPI00301364A4
NFDAAAAYFTEEYLGEAISQALSLGLINSRDELFITSKLWCTDAHGEHVVPALKKTLQNLKLEYVDQYLVHWPVAMKHGPINLQPAPDDFLPLDIKSVWTA